MWPGDEVGWWWWPELSVPVLGAQRRGDGVGSDCGGGRPGCSTIYRAGGRKGGGVVRYNDRQWSGSSMQWFSAREVTRWHQSGRGRGAGRAALHFLTRRRWPEAIGATTMRSEGHGGSDLDWRWKTSRMGHVG
jgi:hypothetical protein